MTIVYNKDGSRNFAMYGIIDGREIKVMEIRYTRAKATAPAASDKPSAN